MFSSGKIYFNWEIVHLMYDPITQASFSLHAQFLCLREITFSIRVKQSKIKSGNGEGDHKDLNNTNGVISCP